MATNSVVYDPLYPNSYELFVLERDQLRENKQKLEELHRIREQYHRQELITQQDKEKLIIAEQDKEK